MVDKKSKLLIVHNIVSPYRLPLFEELSRKYDLEVYFCKRNRENRKWDAIPEEYNFKNEILSEFDIGPLWINPLLPFKLLFNKKDVYLAGDDPRNLFATFITFFMAKIFGKPFILWSGYLEREHTVRMGSGNKINKFTEWVHAKIVNLYQKIIYSKTDAFVAYCEKAKKYLMNRGVKEDKIFVGGQIMPEENLPNYKIEKSQTKYKNKKVILSLGYLEKRKGIEYLIEAYKNLEKNDIVLIIAGSGPDEERLKELSEGREDIEFPGYVEGREKAKYYSIADVFVLPTLHDPWGLVINEALYYDTPVITTEGAGGKDIIENGENGIIIPPGNEGELRGALKFLLEDKNLQEMKKNAKERPASTKVKEGMHPFTKAISKIKKQGD